MTLTTYRDVPWNRPCCERLVLQISTTLGSHPDFAGFKQKLEQGLIAGHGL